MVLQQESTVNIWGWGNPAEKVQISSSWNSTLSEGTADSGGRWKIPIPTPKAGGPYSITVQGGNSIVLEDVMIGEVWVCSGQSNMEWSGNHGLQQCKDEAPHANNPNIRFFYIPKTTANYPQDRCEGSWKVCTPEEMMKFSAVGYFFGKRLHHSLDAPVGLINSNWGGTPAEVWMPRELVLDDSELQVAASQIQPFAWWPKDAGLCYNAMIHPITSYKIAGTIWYQGESNAGRAYQYRDLFPLMIQNWRDVWNQGDFPFYWVQLADFRLEKDQPADSDWAELREAQTMTMSKLPNTGEAVIIDLGEAQDIHPKNKQDVGKRLARWALVKDYGYDIVYRSPIYKSMDRQGNKITLTFNHVGGGMDLFDVRQPIGFTIAGADQKFVRAEAKIINKTQIEVWSESVSNPAAVRYAWADNPVCNVQNKEGLPLTPFRTDDWPGVTIDNH